MLFLTYFTLFDLFNSTVVLDSVEIYPQFCFSDLTYSFSHWMRKIFWCTNIAFFFLFGKMHHHAFRSGAQKSICDVDV